MVKQVKNKARKYFTTTDILNIREKYINGATQLNLARDYSVSQKTISLILKRYTYPNVGVPEDYEYKLETRMGKYYLTRNKTRGKNGNKNL